MIVNHIFSIEDALFDIKDYIKPYLETPEIRLHVVVQNMLDEICFLQGHVSDAEYCMDIGESCALEELSGYDIPPVVCKSVVAKLKYAMLALLVPQLKSGVPYRLSHSQLNEYEYCISIYFYNAKRFQTRHQEHCYATTIPNHWAQSFD